MYEISVKMQSSNPFTIIHNVMLFNYIYMPVFHINMWKEEITNKTVYFTSKHYSFKTNNNAKIKYFYLFSEQR